MLVPALRLARQMEAIDHIVLVFCPLTDFAVHLDFGVREAVVGSVSGREEGIPKCSGLASSFTVPSVTLPGVQPHGHLHPAPSARDFVKNLRRQHPGEGLLPV